MLHLAPMILSLICSTHADCDSAPGAGDGYCYTGDYGATQFPAEGYCTRDDGSGAICDVDADCGDGFVCADSWGYRVCLPACGTNSDCPDNQACFDSFNGWALDRFACVPGNATALDGDYCEGSYDCYEYSQCWANECVSYQ